jgi:porphyrinogen peroxidase
VNRSVGHKPEIAGDRHVSVSTPGDLLFHIRASRLDLCFELAQRLTEALEGHGRVIDEVHGFRSFDERDLLGFVDGTENPEGGAAQTAALITDEDPAFAGGSYVIVQKYVHDLKGWDALGVEAQENAIGRTKLSNLELPDDVKPPNSHVALTMIEDEDGEEQQILRYMFFVPSSDLLDQPPTPDESDPASQDGSLRIGSLRRPR